jgi:hypothetical protein
LLFTEEGEEVEEEEEEEATHAEKSWSTCWYCSQTVSFHFLISSSAIYGQARESQEREREANAELTWDLR